MRSETRMNHGSMIRNLGAPFERGRFHVAVNLLRDVVVGVDAVEAGACSSRCMGEFRLEHLHEAVRVADVLAEVVLLAAIVPGGRGGRAGGKPVALACDVIEVAAQERKRRILGGDRSGNAQTEVSAKGSD